MGSSLIVIFLSLGLCLLRRPENQTEINQTMKNKKNETPVLEHRSLGESNNEHTTCSRQ
jgi:hypothetical protein